MLPLTASTRYSDRLLAGASADSIPQAGFVPTAQWKGWAMKKVPSLSACATALCHASVSAGFNDARICC